MREANHRAAVQIFERVNSSLLPRNILDLHGLHVDEALHHLDQVLEDKASGICHSTAKTRCSLFNRHTSKCYSKMYRVNANKAKSTTSAHDDDVNIEYLNLYED